MSQTNEIVSEQKFEGFGTFTGVFTPTLFILGVIMFVRLGWIVGNAGLLGAFGIITVAMGITGATGLSLSSIATNTRLGAGGPYSVISRSLGLEVGGSIGVPLYLSRPLGVAMYVFGFREGWLWFFPTHNPLLIDLSVFTVLFALAYISTELAFKVQYLIIGIIIASLLSIVFSRYTLDPITTDPAWFGEFNGFPEKGFQRINFWVVFAIFFPATTGILSGTKMSGDLKAPRKEIPQSTLWAIFISAIIYFLLAWWITRAATTDELLNNYNIIIERARWPAVVVVGLLGATFSSALSSFVGGPRILIAMGNHKILPLSEWLSKTTKNEPRNATLFTAILTLGCLMVSDLNLIAPFVTMFFLITYFMINFILLIESSLALPSFRPTMQISRWIPFIGAIGCIFVMFILSPMFGLLSIMISVVIYVYILKRGVKSDEEDVRSGIFSAMAEWAAAKVTELGGSANARAWKPNLLIPIENIENAMGEFSFILDICLPRGSAKLLGIATQEYEQLHIDDSLSYLVALSTQLDVPFENPEDENNKILKGLQYHKEQLQKDLQNLGDSFRKKHVFCTSSVVEASTLEQGTIIGLQALQSAFFRPNILFLKLPPKEEDNRLPEYGKIIQQAHDTKVGVLLFGAHPRSGLGRMRSINLWIRASSDGWNTDSAFRKNNLDLILLMGYRLSLRWKAELHLVTVISDEANKENALKFLQEVQELARIPAMHSCQVFVGSFITQRKNAPLTDLQIMGLQAQPNFVFMRKMISTSRSSCLFVADSGRESARA